VYFAVMKHAGYGKLSGRDLGEQQTNAEGRVADAEEARKQHPFDFALWKGAKPGEPSFPSPWGAGRPGWHIECSAMVREELGDTIDIHLGGADLVFPHHENEIAQSEAASGQELARLWLHNGMVNVGGEKMSKSLGNFTTIRALLESGLSAMTLRLFVLQAHYRKPLDFTTDALEAASSGWKGLNAALNLGTCHGNALGWPNATPLPNGAVMESSIEPLDQGGSTDPDPLLGLRQRFIEAMDDDLNSSGALAVLFELARPLRGLANRLDRGDNAGITASESALLRSRWLLLRELAAVLGLRAETTPEDEASNSAVDTTAIEAAIAARQAAKQAKNYAEADRIRSELTAQGIELIDKPGGITEWRHS
jgi:cysteinyl-tRNA synthetase